MTDVDDITLMAYVDGELDAEAVSSVEARLQHDPVLERKVRRLRESAALVRACANEPIHHPIPHDLIRALERSDGTQAASVSRRRWLAAAGIAALVAGGFGAGYLTKRLAPNLETEAPSDEDLLDEVVAYHTFYAALPPGAASRPADPEVMEKWLSRHMHRDVRIPDLSHNGYRFETARLFLYDNRPIAQIVYQSPGGVPVGLCVVASSKARSRPFRALHREGFTLIAWQREGSDYIVIGALPQAQLRKLSAEISAEL